MLLSGRLSRAQEAAALAAGCGCALAAFALLAWLAHDSYWLRHGDAWALAHASAHRAGDLGQLAGAIAHLGDPVAQTILLLAGIAVALARGRRDAAVAGTVLVLGADLTTHFLKEALAAPRLDPLLGLRQVDANAFPSGHATAAFSMAAAWCLFVPARHRPLVAAIGFAAAGLVAVSVVILHHHVPSDVVGGFLVAAA